MKNKKITRLIQGILLLTAVTTASPNAIHAATENDLPESSLNAMCEGDLSHMNGKIPFDAAQDGDTAAEKVVNDYICYLGETITNFVNIFRPDIVLLSGGICNQGKKLTEPLETYIQDKCFGGSKAFIPKVACAVLGNKAGIIGAANLTGGKER